MARKGTAKVRLEPVGQGRVKAALEGVVADTRASAKKTRREADKTEQHAKKSIRDKARAEKKAARDGLRAVQEAERRKRAAMKRTAREAAATARTEKRRQQQNHRANAGRLRAGVGGALGALGVGTGVAALGVGALTAVNAATAEGADALAQRGGVQSVGQGIGTAADFESRLAQVGNQAFGELDPTEFNERMDAARDRILEVARATNQEPGRLMAGLATFQETFANFDFGLEAMESIAMTAQATGVEFNDLVGALGEAQQQFGITGEQAEEFLAILNQQARQGAITPGDFARTASRQFGGFQALTGRDGIEGFREFGALMQIARRGGGNAETTAISVGALVSSFTERRNQAELANRGGINVREFANEREEANFRRRAARGTVREQDLASGDFRNFGDIARDIAENPNIQSAEDIKAILPNIRGARALFALINDARKEAANSSRQADSFQEIQAASAELGLANLKSGATRSADSVAGQAAALGVQTQADAIENAPERAEVALNTARLEVGLQEELGLAAGLADFIPDFLLTAAAGLDAKLADVALRNQGTVLGDAAASLDGGGALSAVNNFQTAGIAVLWDSMFGAEGPSVSIDQESAAAIGRAVGENLPEPQVIDSGRGKPGGAAHREE